MPLTKIPKDEQLAPGDRVELHFKSSGMAWIKATQIVLLEQKFKNRTDWEIIGWETPVEQPTLLIMRAEVKSFVMQNDPELQRAGVGAVVTCAAIAALVVTCGIVYSLTLQETFLISAQTISKVAESPIGKVAVAGTGIGMLAMMLAALYVFLPKR